MSNHYNSIKQLFPLDLGDASDAEMSVEGSILDGFQAELDNVLGELFASTTTEAISRWEYEYGVTPGSTQTISDRRSAVVAKIVERSSLKYGGLRKSLFISIASAMGYTISIASSPNFFRADISVAGDCIYDVERLWSMIVTVTGVASAPDLEILFTDIRPPHLSLSFIYS